ncbi:hypothetical protein IAD21_05428 [Abditibacteriota bacterium]|nr:hypothetical protein IAD21_05428 [Abditibacteriota bacterium]
MIAAIPLKSHLSGQYGELLYANYLHETTRKERKKISTNPTKQMIVTVK